MIARKKPRMAGDPLSSVRGLIWILYAVSRRSIFRDVQQVREYLGRFVIVVLKKKNKASDDNEGLRNNLQRGRTSTPDPSLFLVLRKNSLPPSQYQNFAYDIRPRSGNPGSGGDRIPSIPTHP